MLHHGQTRIVAVVAVQRGEPEELVAPDLTAQADTPYCFVVRRRIKLRRAVWTIVKERNRGQSSGRIIGKDGRGGLRDPLAKWIPRPPGVLAVEEKSLPVQPIGAAQGLNVHPPAGSAQPFGLRVAGRCFHFADRRLGHLGAAPA